jgi:hypothetical protein
MFFNWYHKVVVKYKYFRKKNSLEALEAAGSGFNLGFNYSHLEKQDKELFTEVVTWEWIVWLEIINQKNHSGSWSAGAHRRGPADFCFFPKSTKNKYTTSFGGPTAQKICSNYSIRRWSFLFIYLDSSPYKLIWTNW